MARQGGLQVQAAKEEFLGRTITVKSATDPTLVGLTGEVLDETMKTFVVRTAAGRTVTIAKATVTLALHLGDRAVEIDGNTLLFRPEDRIKKVRPARSTRQSSR
jgi:ribonuclease P protein subunit POP4